MRFWAGVTDNTWYQFVSSRAFGEVNFWQPSARAPFTGLPAGTPFLFKLKRPNHHIAGGGHFVRYTKLPLLTAWEVFGEQNGASSLRDLAALIGGNRRAAAVSLDTEIGCTVLTDVFFLPRDRWIPANGLFAPSIMVGRTYDAIASADARVLWESVVAARRAVTPEIAEDPDERRFGREFLTRARLGQGSFRTLVIDAYQRKCAITGESTLPALEAAHIQAYAEDGTHHVSNGLLLRSDFHKLFDAGLVTVDPDLRVHISGRIRDRYFNGKAYYRLHGQELASIPQDVLDRPNADYLRWHNENRFVA
jgi:putative restriction endonuclease